MNTDLLTLAAYTADYWQHVCPMVRLISPADQTGVKLIQGTEWTNQHLSVFPERLEEADVVVITRDFPRWQQGYEQVMEKARALNKKVIYDLDDLLLELPESHPDYAHYLPSFNAILKAVIEVDAVVGSTPALCDYLRRYNPNVRLWENYLDDRKWQLKPPQMNDGFPVRLGYMGGHSHSYDLEPVVPVLESILQKYSSKVQMVFWGIKPPERLLNLENVEWAPVALVSYLEFVTYFQCQLSDIFIAPLQDNLFNHSKSHLKFLEYGALGAPGVFSRVTPYERVVTHGHNGFLASTPEEWEASITALIDDPELRYRMGSNAQETIRKNWLLSNHIQAWKDLYLDLTQTTRLVEKSSDALRVAQKMYAIQRDIMREANKNRAELQEKSRILNEQDRTIQELNQLVQDKDRSLNEINKLAQHYYTSYQEVVTSRSWRLMLRLIKLRLRLIPRGSLPERLLAAVYRSLSALKNQGVAASVRQLRAEARTIRQARQIIQQPDAPYALSTEIYTGPVAKSSSRTAAAITVLVIEDDESDGTVSTQQVLDWINSQTIRESLQAAHWNPRTGNAKIFDASSTRSASDLHSLIEGFDAKYVCIASEDLIRQPGTYLETNLIALETENLAFTVNLLGVSELADRELNSGRLPYSPSLPLLRIVARKDCLQSDLTLKLDAFLNSQKNIPGDGQPSALKPAATIVGKVLVHTTNHKDSDDAFEFREPHDLHLHAIGRHLYIESDAETGQGSLPLLLLPVDRIVSPVPVPSDLPTVILVMPFLAVGGAEKIALKIMENLADKVRFIVLTFDPLDPELGTTADQFRQITPYVYQIPDFLNSELNDSFVRYLIARFNPQSVYIANGTSWIYDALANLKRDYPSIRFVNQVYDYTVGWINRYDLPMIMYMDGHIGSNPKICQAYLDKGATPDQVFFIENGTDPVELDPAKYDDARKADLREQFGLPSGTKVVTFASRFNPQKRPLDFVELARRFSSDPSVSFLMVGDGPLAQPVVDQVHRSGIQNIFLKSFYQPISDILAITDVLVLPSEFEGMPMIVIETQTMGKPVVATDVGNIREIIERTAGGVVVSQIGDITALMAGVRKMLTEPPSPAELRRTTLRYFDWKVCAEKHLPAFFGPNHA